jgi:hypothetical protein
VSRVKHHSNACTGGMRGVRVIGAVAGFEEPPSCLVIEPFCKLEGIALPEKPGRAYVGGLFGAGGPPADIRSVAVLCCSAQESDAVARVAAIIAVTSREMIFAPITPAITGVRPNEKRSFGDRIEHFGEQRLR